MKFLAVDTSGDRLIAVAKNGERREVFDELCPMRHSVRLMEAVDGVLKGAGLALGECDFLACVVGPGSFTGIRIGISAVKGMCFAKDIPALSLTSFDCLAYADGEADTIAAVDAGHGFVYAEGKGLPRGYYPISEVLSRQEGGTSILVGAPIEGLGGKTVSLSKGLCRAAEALAERKTSAAELAAVYLRKSSAEEGR